jgi:hypothetical protein
LSVRIQGMADAAVIEINTGSDHARSTGSKTTRQSRRLEATKCQYAVQPAFGFWAPQSLRRTHFELRSKWSPNLPAQIVFHASLPKQNDIDYPPYEISAERHQLEKPQTDSACVKAICANASQ